MPIRDGLQAEIAPVRRTIETLLKPFSLLATGLMQPPDILLPTMAPYYDLLDFDPLDAARDQMRDESSPGAIARTWPPPQRASEPDPMAVRRRPSPIAVEDRQGRERSSASPPNEGGQSARPQLLPDKAGQTIARPLPVGRFSQAGRQQDNGTRQPTQMRSHHLMSGDAGDGGSRGDDGNGDRTARVTPQRSRPTQPPPSSPNDHAAMQPTILWLSKLGDEIMNTVSALEGNLRAANGERQSESAATGSTTETRRSLALAAISRLSDDLLSQRPPLPPTPPNVSSAAYPIAALRAEPSRQHIVKGESALAGSDSANRHSQAIQVNAGLPPEMLAEFVAELVNEALVEQARRYGLSL